MPERVLMADVAKHAGVSLQTVSRVVNGSAAVSETTRANVQKAIDTLGYRPNMAARNLAAGQTNALGIILTGAVDFGVSLAFRAIEHAASEHGYYLCVVTAEGDERYEMAVEQLIGQAVAGCIVLARSTEVLEVVQRVAPTLPTCMVFATTDHTLKHTAAVGVDQLHGIRLLVDHLLSIGCKRLCHIAGDTTWDDAHARKAAFSELCEARGVEHFVVPGNGWSAEAGYQAVDKIFPSHVERALGSSIAGLPDGIVAANDNLALGAMRCLRERGYDIPGDVVVTGFDDAPHSAWVTPSLTTVTQDFTAMGAAALRAMADVLQGASGYKITLTPELVVRESTKRIT